LKRPKPIGRKKEINLLTRLINSPEAEFLAVYGRRRVGKTYLLQTILSAQKNYFEGTGLKDGSTAERTLRDDLSFLRSEGFIGFKGYAKSAVWFLLSKPE
jgi:AAA+ ATPase superfamily predicted ATPase